MIYIRKIKQADNAALALMIRQIFHEYDAPQEGTVYSDPTTDRLFELFREERSLLWVAEQDHTLIGCCGIFPTKGLPEDCAELVKFYVSTNFQGQGIGKRLMEKCIESAKDLGYQELYLESIPVFSKAVGMYEKQGFVHLNSPLGDSGHGGCDIWMLMKI